MANEAYFNGKWSLFRICHSCCFLSINNLSGFFLEIVMGDRWFGKNIFAFGTLLVLVLVLFQYYLYHTFPFRFKIVILFSSCNSCWCISFWITVQRYGFFSTHSELSRRYAKIVEKKLVLSLEMTKINLPVTKINLLVTKIEISMTKMKSLCVWRQGCDVKAWFRKTSFLILKTYI